jgi:hypothetical protein
VDPSPAEIIDEAWMLCFSRAPGEKERKEFESLLAGATTATEKREVVEDLYWSLLTSREFLFQH